MLKSLFNFLLFSSIYIAVCAVIMVWQTNAILGLHYDYLTYNAFVFFSTICSYNFHWYLTPLTASGSERLHWGDRHRKMMIIFYVIGAVGALYFFWQLRMHWLPLAGGAVLTFLYSAPKLPQRAFVWLRKIAVGKTLFLTTVWMYVTTLLPVFISPMPFTWYVVFFALHRFFLIFAICILFDYRDVESDKAERIRTITTLLPDKYLFKVYYIVLGLSALTALLLWPITTPAVIGTLLAPVLITGLLTRRAISDKSDYMYYFVLDGLMMFSAVLHMLLGGV